MSQQKVPIDEGQHEMSENTSQQNLNFKIRSYNRLINRRFKITPYKESINPKHTAEINNEDAATDSSSIKLFIGILIIAILLYYLNPYSCSNTCDMGRAINRDFNRYYGIVGSDNHFKTSTADDCNSNIVYTSVLPQSILKSDHSASSFIILAKYGTGKTLLRCEYFKSLNTDKYLKVLILNKQISEYIERFVQKNSRHEKDCRKRNCLDGWTQNEFAQLVLSTLATEFINLFQHKNIKLSAASIEEKIELITIVCFYYSGFGIGELENFINYFLNKPPKSMYKADKALAQIQERNLAQDKPLLVHFKSELEKLFILKQDYLRLHLLLTVVEGEGFQNRASSRTMYENVFNDLTHFSFYIKKYLNKVPVFVIDGIDENQYFYNINGINKASIEAFCRSSIAPDILTKAMANDFYLSIFYPTIEGIYLQDHIPRKDKFPEHEITWNTKSLINYADYILQGMNKNASRCRCKSFTDFKTLVNYSNGRIAEIIKKIPTPRALHYFMNELIRQMNNDAIDARKPFQASFENVQIAYEKSFKFYDEIHQANQSEIFGQKTFS